jgi:hypothetical protein
MDEKKLIILVQGHECFYNLQHKDYDNLVKDNCWKEIIIIIISTRNGIFSLPGGDRWKKMYYSAQ